jgi:hypothetical protein
MNTLIHEAVSGEIVGAAMTILNALKPGLDEKLYENALVIELRERGHIWAVEQQSNQCHPCNQWLSWIGAINRRNQQLCYNRMEKRCCGTGLLH